MGGVVCMECVGGWMGWVRTCLLDLPIYSTWCFRGQCLKSWDGGEERRAQGALMQISLPSPRSLPAPLLRSSSFTIGWLLPGTGDTQDE